MNRLLNINPFVELDVVDCGAISFLPLPSTFLSSFHPLSFYSILIKLTRI